MAKLPTPMRARVSRLCPPTAPVPATATVELRNVCCSSSVTHADLAGMVEQRSFRADLFYRLQRLKIGLSPLRNRPEDILPLAEHFLAAGRSDGLRPAMDADVQQWLRAREWPGNVRELRNVIERLRLLHSDKLEYHIEDMDCPEAGEGPAALDLVSGGTSRAKNPASSRSDTETEHAAILSASRAPMRQLDRLRALFERHRKLTRKEVMQLLQISHATATRYLKSMRAEGVIEKVAPSGSPRTHYFRVRETAPRAPSENE
jgi:DNA-binding NtrC family response regulator